MAESKYQSSMLSQDLIDSLLDDAMNADSSVAQDNSDSGLITEDEINMLLEGASTGSDVDITDVDNLSDLDDSEDSGSGLVSQNEINNLLNGNGADNDDDLVSQGDIEALLNESSGGGNISQDDLDNLLSGADSDGSDDQAGIDALLNAGDNEDAEENELISQNDIDNLLGGGGGLDAIDEQDDGIPAPSGDIGELLDNEDEEEEGSLISQDDIDKLLSTDIDDDDGDETESDLISQDDISSLLNTEDDEPADTEESLISQDDINKLMNLDDDFDLTEQDPMDSIDKDISDPIDEESVDELLGTDTDTVILEEPKKKKKGWLVKAVVFATILLLVGGGTFSYFKFFRDTEPEVVDIPIKEKVEEIVEIPEKKDPAKAEKPQTDNLEKKDEVMDPVNDDEIVFTKMSHFIVLAPNTNKTTYISGDISIELMTASLNKIKENEAFYRNVIYRAIKASMAENGDTKIVKEDLAEKLKKELKDQNLNVENVVFTDFEQG